MKTAFGRNARLLALIAVLPLGLWACGDGDDSTDGPTGPSSKYNPKMDYPSATITATVSPSAVAPGGQVLVIAGFKDGNGAPVEGIPLKISAENGAADKYFTYQTNPTLTSSNGKASINVTVAGNCPEGSYAFVITPASGPSVQKQVGIEVSESAGGGTAVVTTLSLTTTTASVVEDTPANFVATATASSSCTLRFQHQATGAGLSVGWTDAPGGTTSPYLFSLVPSTPGTLTVIVQAYCTETPTDHLVSDPVNVTVTAPTP